MDSNKEYAQINVHTFSGYRKNYDALKGKVVDKVAFTISLQESPRTLVVG